VSGEPETGPISLVGGVTAARGRGQESFSSLKEENATGEGFDGRTVRPITGQRFLGGGSR